MARSGGLSAHAGTLAGRWNSCDSHTFFDKIACSTLPSPEDSGHSGVKYLQFPQCCHAVKELPGSLLSSISWSPNRMANLVRKRIESSNRTRRRPGTIRSACAVEVRKVRHRLILPETPSTTSQPGIPPSQAARGDRQHVADQVVEVASRPLQGRAQRLRRARQPAALVVDVARRPAQPGTLRAMLFTDRIRRNVTSFG